MGESKVFGVRLPLEDIERLKEAKWDLRKPVNAIVREAITEYLDRQYKVLEKKTNKK